MTAAQAAVGVADRARLGDPLRAVRRRRRDRDDPGHPGPARHGAHRRARHAAARDPPHGDHRGATPTVGPARSTRARRAWIVGTGDRRPPIARVRAHRRDRHAPAAGGHGRPAGLSGGRASCAGRATGPEPGRRASGPRWRTPGSGGARGSSAGSWGSAAASSWCRCSPGCLGMPLKRALGTSLLAIVVLVIPGTIVHTALGHIDWADLRGRHDRRRAGRADRRRIALGTRGAHPAAPGGDRSCWWWPSRTALSELAAPRSGAEGRRLRWGAGHEHPPRARAPLSLVPPGRLRVPARACRRARAQEPAASCSPCSGPDPVHHAQGSRSYA